MDDAPLINQMLDRLSALLGTTVSLELVLAAFALVLGAGFFTAFLRKRRLNQRYARQRKWIVRELLLNANDQRATLELEFCSAEMQGRIVSGPCSLVEDSTMTVDVGFEQSLQTWIGEPVEASFKLDYKDTSAYYRFDSTVVDTRSGSRGTSVQLALPLYIHPVQKRHYVRINPLPSHLLGMGLWLIDPAQPLPLDSTSLGCASLSYRPGKLTQCSLLNLSAGGMRMGVSQALLQQFPTRLTLQSRLLCLLLLRSPDNEHPMPFWLACSIVSLAEEQDNASIVHIAVKFKAWALAEKDRSDIFWFPAGKSGEVSPLASWILRHQLGQNKQRE